MSAESSEGAIVVPRGVQLTVQRGDVVKRYCLPCQWLNFSDGLSIPKAPEVLLLADLSPSYKHIALIEMNREMDLVEAVIESKTSHARGVICVHFSDRLPLENPLIPMSSDISIPVVLIQNSFGLHLVRDTSDDSQTVMVQLVKESSVDDTVQKYQDNQSGSPQRLGDQHLTVTKLEPKAQGRFRFQPKIGFHLCRRLKNLLHDKAGHCYIVHKDPDWLCQTFQLFDDFEKKCAEESNRIGMPYIKKKITKATKELIMCSEATGLVDFPFHVLMVWRLHQQEAFSDIDEVQNYRSKCVSSLKLVNQTVITSTLLPFLSLNMFLPWGGKEVYAAEALHQFFQRLYRDMTVGKKQPKGMNENAAELQLTLTAAMLYLSLHEKLEKNALPDFWKVFLKRVKPEKLPWSLDVSKSFKAALNLGVHLGLSPRHAFDAYALICLIAQYKIYDMKQLNDILGLLYPVIFCDNFTWITLSGHLRGHLASDLGCRASFTRATYADQETAFALEASELLSGLYSLCNLNVEAETSFTDGGSVEVAQLSDSDVDDEAAKWTDVIIGSIQLKAGSWAFLVNKFRMNSPKKLRKLISERVLHWLEVNCSRITVAVFVDIVDKLAFVSKEIVGKYLVNYKQSQPALLTSDTWKQLFSIILRREWTSLKRGILVFLKATAAACAERPVEGGQNRFFYQLLVLSQPTSLPNLLSLQDDANNGDSVKGEENVLLDDLKTFLVTYFQTPGASVALRGSLEGTLSYIGSMGVSHFRDTLLSVFVLVAVPTVDELLQGVWAPVTKKFVKVLTEELKHSATVCGPSSPLPNCSLRSEFLWRILALICSYVPVSSWKLTNAPDLAQLASVFAPYWPPAAADQSVVIFQTDIDAYLSSGQQTYREWFFSVRESLGKHYSRLLDGEMTVQEMEDCLQKRASIAALYRSFSCTNMCVISENLHTKLGALESMADTLASLLYFPAYNTSDWRELLSLLIQWKVKIDPKVLKAVKCHLSVEQNEGAKRALPDLTVRFTPQTTFRQVEELHDLISEWISPLLDLKVFLCYFAAQNSSLYRAYLEEELEKADQDFPKEIPRLMRTNVQPHSTIFPSPSSRHLATMPMRMRPAFPDSDSEDEYGSEPLQSGIVPLETFVSALESTKNSLENLLGNKARFHDVAVLAQDRFKGVDVNEEFIKISSFSEFKGKYDVSRVKQAINDMLELVQYSGLIATIVGVCEQYRMEKCLEDKQFEELKRKGDILRDVSKVRQMTTGHCSELKREFDFLLGQTSKDRLHLFDAVKESEEFFKFIREQKFYTKRGRGSFLLQVTLITNHLQDQEYNHTVLNHLMVAFECVAPFANPDTTFVDLLTKLNKSELFRLQNWIGQINTVNSNMTLIKFWFSKAQGDTLENVTRDLQAIMQDGKIKFILGHSTTVIGIGSCKMVLSYVLQSQGPVQKLPPTPTPIKESSSASARPPFPLQSFRSFNEAFSEKPPEPDLRNLVVSTKPGEGSRQQIADASHVRVVKRTMNLEELEDFVRKLGFVENEGDAEHQERIKDFQKRFERFREIFRLSVQLFKLGHCDFQAPLEPYPVAMPELEAMLEDRRKLLRHRSQEIASLQRMHIDLLLFNMRAIFVLAEGLKNNNLEKVCQLVSRLFDSQGKTVGQLRQCVASCLKSLDTKEDGDSVVVSPTKLPMERVGTFLERLKRDPQICHDLYPRRREMGAVAARDEGHVVHLAFEFSLDQILKLILIIYGGFPESYELMRCTKGTSKEEVQLFLQRVINFHYRRFTLVQVNELNVELQEEVLRFQLNPAYSAKANVNYILTKHSVFHEAPWITVKQYKDNDLAITHEEAVVMFHDWVLKPYRISLPLIVHGQPGDGKSHYIKKCIKGEACVIPVHEAFTPLLAIQKLQKLDLTKGDCYIYFNFTASPPSGDSTSDDVAQYRSLMAEVFWFLFSLIGMGFVEDVETGESFRLSASLQWHIFVEVPSSPVGEEHSDSLSGFLEWIPLFKYVGAKNHVSREERLDVDNDVQLVCKYLKAYSSGDIDRLHKNKREVKFSSGPRLDADDCHALLKRYMPKHVKESKLMQHLFVKYMKRRCNVLENAPGFYLNEGVGESYKDSKTGKTERTDTKKLGSTLMSAMLREVADMCNPKIKSNWREHAHQQLVYDFKGGSASFQFLSLCPEELEVEEKLKLERMGIKIPSVVDLNRRELLDSYLSSALDLKLDERGRLTAIDREKYVLTVDYAVKMLNIHERRMCGVPVIIEGETGVGKTSLVRMLSILWNESVCESRQGVIQRIVDSLRKRLAGAKEEEEGYEHVALPTGNVEATWRVAEALSRGKPPSEEDVHKTCKNCRGVLKVLLDFAEDLMDPSVDGLLEEQRTYPTPEGTAELLWRFLTSDPLQTFFKLSVHAALSTDDIKEFMRGKIVLAETLQRRRRRHATSQAEAGSRHCPTVVLFFDEINTSSCIGLFKEILVDRAMEGEPIPENLFFVAACNPHRGSSTTISSTSEREDWVLGSYYVRQLPPTLHFLRWDYGALDEYQENAYIQQKISMDETVLGLRVNQLSDAISVCQQLIREFAYFQLIRVGFSERNAAVRSKSCVSQRDIQRVFTLASFFQRSYVSLPDESPAPKTTTDPTRRAIMVAIGIVYYLRLDTRYRKEFSKRIDDVEAGSGDVPFLHIFESEIDTYVDKMHLPRGIAKTKALKENLFATVVCTVCRIPLIIVGAPGSSKTLSFNLTLSNLKGAESKKKTFRNTDRFPALDPHHYQCSRRSTSIEIKNVFTRAISRQQNHNNSQLPINCVVFMDEAGLPEESHESLKVLHYYLDDPQVSFVAITNHILDAAKSNRAVNLFRPKTDLTDLQTLAKGCMHSDVKNPPPHLRNIMDMIGKFCKAYLELMEKEEFKDFFGLRDFIHFISYLRRHRGTATELSHKLVLSSLERNFNGIPNFQAVADLFLSVMGEPTVQPERRNIVKILKDSLSEQSLAHCADDEGAEAEVRYKLIIDTSEDDSMARLLFHHGVLDRESTRIFSCSNFPGDDEMQKVHIISAIKHSAMEGKTVILSQTDDINESFYDLFNQHFRRIDDPNHGRRYYTNIAIGSHSKPCRVDPKFQCIVHMRQSELKDAPAPFLNRFEKFRISQEDLLETSLQALPCKLRSLATLARDKANGFKEALGQQNFYGCKKETIDSLFLELLPVSSDDKPHKSLSIERRSDHHEEDEDEDDGDDFDVFKDMTDEEWDCTAEKVLEELELFLRNEMGFSFSSKSEQERKTQAEAIFLPVCDLLRNCDLTGVKQRLKSDSSVITKWLVGGLSAGQSDLKTRTKENSWLEISQVETLTQAFAVASVLQWMVYHVCSRLLQIAIPEAIVLNAQVLPHSYSRQYLHHQHHFSFDDVCRFLSRSEASLTKTVCFTRTNPRIQSFPSKYSDSSSAGTSFESIVPSNLAFMMCKLGQVPTLESFQGQFQTFLSSPARLFLVIANMEACSVSQVNLVRTMAEEKKAAALEAEKMFVLLLHFPLSKGNSQPCYPSLFLHGWDHIYLENVVRLDKGSLVDIGQWLSAACLTGDKELSSLQAKFQDTLFSVLPTTVNLALSKILFGDHPKCHFNRKMNPGDRSSMLLNLLDKMPSFGRNICRKFVGYLKRDYVTSELVIAAESLMATESALSIADKIESKIKSLFNDYLAYVLYQLNIDYNLEILFDPEKGENVESVKNLFVEIFSAMPVPRVLEISVRKDTFDARQPQQQRRSNLHVFPFFNLVARIIERRLDEILVGIHEELKPSFDESNSSDENEKKSAAMKLEMIEIRAANSLLQSLEGQEGDHDEDMNIAITAFKAIKEKEHLWDCYLTDFARTKFNCNMGNPGSSEQILLSTWIGDLQAYPVQERVVALHVVARLRQKSIGRAVAALRPLEMLRSLPPAFKSQMSRLSSSLLASSVKTIEIKDERLYSYIIAIMFNCLKNMIGVEKVVEDSFSKWCSVYRNLCASLPDMATFPFSDLTFRPKLQCLHAVFVLVRSLDFTDVAIKAGFELAQELIPTAIAQDESMTASQLASDILSLHLRSVLESGIQCLKEAFSKDGSAATRPNAFTVAKCTEAFVSDILTFYFPPLSPDCLLACSLKDCEMLLQVINDQTPWFTGSADQVATGPRGYGLIQRTVSVEQCVEATRCVPIGLVNFKLFQDCLTQILKSHCGSLEKRTQFSVQIRDMVGEFLAKNPSSGSPVPYVPLCYPCSSRKDGQLQPLASAYFHCCLRQLGFTVQNASFANLLQRSADIITEIDNGDISAEAKEVLYIERQALLQLIISRFAELFDPSKGELLRKTTTEGIVNEINSIFQEDSWGGGKHDGHRLSFLHHVSKQLHSTRQAVKLFTEDYKAKCSAFLWMEPIRESLKQPPEIQAHLFPFMIAGQSGDKIQAVIYRKMKSLLTIIANIKVLEDCQSPIKDLNEFCKEQTEGSPDLKYQVRMCLWLHVYYSFYEKRIPCKYFADAIMKSFECLGLEEGQRCLIACFLDPDRMIREKEPLNPINPEAERLEFHGGRARRKQERSSFEFDAIWELFNLGQTSKHDASDTDLRRTLALLVGVSLGIPPGRTHLWSHLFHPELIEGTLVCGNMYKYSVKAEGLLLDCGCEFTEDGDYGRADYLEYARRGTLSLHSRYLLLWMSFGAFATSLLTQTQAKNIIKGHVISEWQSVRHYCVGQLKTTWLLLRENLNLSDEERTFFVTSALYKFFEVGTGSVSGLSSAVFNSQSDVDDYELTFHTKVFQPVLSQFEDKKYLDEKIWQRHQLLSSAREFANVYPTDASPKDFMHSLEYLEGAGRTAMAEELRVLIKFFTEKQRLRVGGLLLPDLIEFYQWLHGELSHLITFDQAFKLTIGHVVSKLTDRYSKKYATYVQRLYARVKEKYNEYIKLVQGAIGFGACARVRRENDLDMIRDSSPLHTFLSDSEEGEGPDAFFVVISDLIKNQNEFVNAMTMASSFSKKSGEQLPIHPLEVVYHNCLLGDMSALELAQYLRAQDDGIPKETGGELLRLIQSQHLYVPGAGITVDCRDAGGSDMTASLISQYDFRASSMFNFHRLQQAIIEAYIAGKPLIEDPKCIRKVFRYRSEVRQGRHLEGLKSSSGMEAYVDILPLKDQLPNEFQMSFPAEMSKRLEIAFHNLNYQGTIDVLKALRTIAGHVNQMKMEENDDRKFKKMCQEMRDDPIGKFFAQTHGSKDGQFPSSQLDLLDSAQSQEMFKIPYCCLCDAVDFFCQKLLRREYEFAHLPITLKTPLPVKDAEAISGIPKAFLERGMKTELLDKLKEFEQVLCHAELDMSKEPQQTFKGYLVHRNFFSVDELPVSILPETIRVEHYMQVRMQLRSLINETQSSRRSKVSFEGKPSERWTEVVPNIWKEFPHLEPDTTTGFGKTFDVDLPLVDITTGAFVHIDHLWFEGAVNFSEDDDDDTGSEFATVDEDDYDDQFPGEYVDQTFIRPLLPNLGNLASGGQAKSEELSDAVSNLEKGNDNEEDEGFEIVSEDMVGSLPKAEFGPELQPARESKESPLVVTAASTASVMAKELEDATNERSIATKPENPSKMPPGARSSGSQPTDGKSVMGTSMMATVELGDLSGMSVDDVSFWLADIGFGKYAENFKEEAVDGGTLQELDQDGLKEVGIKSGLDRAKILNKIRKKRLNVAGLETLQ
eukprot:m.294339 g.294339  ORF g.294339 m.294339 type:complete len:5643 (+) comp40744_c0_seq7:98-17026(+)